MPEIAIEALRAQKRRQADERTGAGQQWREHGLVSTTTGGTPGSQYTSIHFTETLILAA